MQHPHLIDITATTDDAPLVIDISELSDTYEDDANESEQHVPTLKALVHYAATRLMNALQGIPQEGETRWEQFWRVRAERQAAAAAFEAAERKRLEEWTMIKRDFPTLDPDAVLRMRDEIRAELTTTIRARTAAAAPVRPAEKEIDAFAVALEIAATGTASITALKETMGLSQPNATKVRTALLGATFGLRREGDPDTILSVEPVATPDKKSGNLATINPALIQVDGDTRARMIEAVITRDVLKRPYTAPIITGTPTGLGVPYEPTAVPRAPRRL